MHAPREACEHREALVPARGLAKHDAIDDHGRVRTEHRQRRIGAPHGERLRGRDACHIVAWRLARPWALINIGALHAVHNSELLQQLAAARRG